MSLEYLGYLRLYTNNRQNIIEALLWLKKTQPTLQKCHHQRIKFGLDEGQRRSQHWARRYNPVNKRHTTLQGAVNRRRDGFSRSQKNGFWWRPYNKCDLEIGAMHPNVSNPLPNAHNTELIESFIDKAKQTGQSSKVMDFPPIDHDNPIK